MPFSFPLQLRIDEPDGGGRAGRRRDQREQRRARVAQILMRQIDQVLRIGDVVQSRDRPVADVELFVHHLHHRRQTVRGARGRGHDVADGRIVQMIVDPDHDIQGIVLGWPLNWLDWRRHDYLAHAALEIRP